MNNPNPEEEPILIQLVNRNRKRFYFMALYAMLYGIQPIDDPRQNKIWLDNFSKWFAAEVDKD